jgi:parvulin-like peptidyl-prolyl isomerase
MSRNRHLLRGLPLLFGVALILIIHLAPRVLGEDDVRYRDGIVAEVNGEAITRHEVEVFSRLTAEYRSMLKQAQGIPNVAERRNVFLKTQLDTLIEERVLMQEAAKQKLALEKPDERRLDREIERLSLQYGGVEGLKRQLENIGVPYDYFVDRKRSNMLIGKLLLKNVSREIFVPPEQIRRYYNEHQEKYPRKGRIVLRHLMLYSAIEPADLKQAPHAVREIEQKEGWNADKALEVAKLLHRKALDPGGDFAAIAREWTMGDHAKEGGLCVFDQEDVPLLPPVGGIASQLKAGEITDPIISRLGVHLVQMVERRAPGVLPFHEVQREIEHRLKSDAWQERLKAWIKRLRDEAVEKSYLKGSD